MERRFAQVDVFGAEPFLGNPVAVVVDGDGVSDADMALFARWTNLSETTFICAPTDPSADYRVRIWTTSGELPFAGHPTIGSAHAWLEAGGVPRGDSIVQECGAGLVDVRRLWPDLLDAVKLKRRYTWILLSQNAQVAAVDDKTLTIALVNAGARNVKCRASRGSTKTPVGVATQRSPRRSTVSSVVKPAG